MTPDESLPACDKGMRRYKHCQTLQATTSVCLAEEWPEPLHECLQLQGNQIRSKTELPDLCRCGRACPRSAAHEILGERQRRWWGLFWWRGSINIALPPPRLLVCLAAHSYTAQWREASAGKPSKWRRHARLNGCVRAAATAQIIFFLTLFSRG